jgi:hypothetical protein
VTAFRSIVNGFVVNVTVLSVLVKDRNSKLAVFLFLKIAAPAPSEVPSEIDIEVVSVAKLAFTLVNAVRRSSPVPSFA